MRSLITIQQRSENGYGFYMPGLKTGVENGIFWFELGQDFGEPGGTSLPEIPRTGPRVVVVRADLHVRVMHQSIPAVPILPRPPG